MDLQWLLIAHSTTKVLFNMALTLFAHHISFPLHTSQLDLNDSLLNLPTYAFIHVISPAWRIHPPSLSSILKSNPPIKTTSRDTSFIKTFPILLTSNNPVF